MAVSAATFWDKMADKYAKSKIEDISADELILEKTKGYLKASDSVLEIGCGTGLTEIKLATGVASYTASDVSVRMVEIA